MTAIGATAIATVEVVATAAAAAATGIVVSQSGAVKDFIVEAAVDAARYAWEQSGGAGNVARRTVSAFRAALKENDVDDGLIDDAAESLEDVLKQIDPKSSTTAVACSSTVNEAVISVRSLLRIMRKVRAGNIDAFDVADGCAALACLAANGYLTFGIAGVGESAKPVSPQINQAIHLSREGAGV
jgi:hypothetical protein